MKETNEQKARSYEIHRFACNNIHVASDLLAVEEPLLIQVHHPLQSVKNIAVLMRTPGRDDELAAGFCYTEGLIESWENVVSVELTQEPEQRIIINLSDQAYFDPGKAERNFYTGSSCGICGKQAIEQIHQNVPFVLPKPGPILKVDTLFELPDKLRCAQPSFETTGGIHATGIFDLDGNLTMCREDVGRHNAMDKLIGNQLMNGTLPLFNSMMVVSGRASFELIQKSLMAGIQIVVCIGAPSTLAVQLAQSHNQTLVGFLKKDGFNIYTCPERIQM